jgi:hypothetical protein
VLHEDARITTIRENKVIDRRRQDAHRRPTLYCARMRHVGTLIAAAVIAPLAWILLAFGQDRSMEVFARAHDGGALHTGDFVRPLEYLAVAGLLLGLIATLRLSPLGAVATGAVYMSSYALLLVAPHWLMSLFRHNLSIAGHQADPAIPIRTGTTLLIGALLLVGAFSVGRWRRRPRTYHETSGTAGERPLGADGLEPERDTEPELAVLYTARPVRAGQSSWQSSW